MQQQLSRTIEINISEKCGLWDRDGISLEAASTTKVVLMLALIS